MTEKEFLGMISEEIEKINQEKNKIKQIENEFANKDLTTNEQHDLNYKKILNENKIYDLCNLIKLPEYARIQVMSDIEVEEYKKEKINELQLKIDEIKEIINQSKLTKRDVTSKNNVDDLYNIINSLQKEINEIKNKTTQEIKQQLLLNIKEKDSIEETISFINVSEGTYFDLLGTVGFDSIKAYKIANLLKEYKIMSDNLKDERCNIKEFLPSEFYEKLIKYNSNFFTNISILLDYNKLVNIILKYEEDFIEAKNIFINEFTEEKLSQIIYFNYSDILKEFDPNTFIDRTKVDFQFLQQHSNKLKDKTLINLKNIVNKRDNLLKQEVKTEDIENEINNLNNQIIRIQSVIYYNLLGWYLSQNMKILGIKSGFSFDITNLTKNLVSKQMEIEETQKLINELKIYINNGKELIEQRKKSYELKRNLIFQEFMNLFHSKFENVEIKDCAISIDYNLFLIADCVAKNYERDIIKKILKEAQNQADIKEATLRGISIEQLKQLKSNEVEEKVMLKKKKQKR